MVSSEGLVKLPGLVDLHVHLREPSSNNAETISSGTRAALIGGYALIGDMPNNPDNPTWDEYRLLEKHAIARNTAYIPTTFHAGSQPEANNVGQLAKMAKHSLWLKLYGGVTTGNLRDYEAAEFEEIVSEWHRVAPNKPIGFHAGQDNLEDMIGLVARKYEHPLHIHHVSSSREVMLAQAARNRGQTVTTEVTPHHLIKTSHDVRSEGWYARCVPPLIDQDEAERLMYHLAEGLIDIVATDHAPWPTRKKFIAEDVNPEGEHGEGKTTCNGMPSIEVAAPLLFYQAHRGFIDPGRLIDAMSTRPAEILGVKIAKNTRAMWDMREYRIGEDDVQSLSNWTPYMGKLAIGVVESFDISGTQLISDFQVIRHWSKVITSRGTEI